MYKIWRLGQLSPSDAKTVVAGKRQSSIASVACCVKHLTEANSLLSATTRGPSCSHCMRTGAACEPYAKRFVFVGAPMLQRNIARLHHGFVKRRSRLAMRPRSRSPCVANPSCTSVILFEFMLGYSPGEQNEWPARTGSFGDDLDDYGDGCAWKIWHLCAALRVRLVSNPSLSRQKLNLTLMLTVLNGIWKVKDCMDWPYARCIRQAPRCREERAGVQAALCICRVDSIRIMTSSFQTIRVFKMLMQTRQLFEPHGCSFRNGMSIICCRHRQSPAVHGPRSFLRP